MMVPMRCCVMPTLGRVMPMLCHVMRMMDERPARAVPEHLPVT
jgi:hypothetical protein